MAYTFDGLPDRRYHEHTAFSATKKDEYVYAYNDARQEKSVTHYWDGSSTGVSLSSKVYDAWGRLSTDTKGGSSSLKTTYGYDLRSRLTGLSETNFSQTLGYTKGSHISSQNWTQNGVSQSYSYSYDGLSRLKNGSYNSTGRNNTVGYTYDKHGNPLTIQRNGMTSSSGYGLIDNLTFTYIGNQMTAVNDGASNIPYSFSHDFKNYTNQANEYTYDKNGNQTKDLNRGLSSVTYNSLNLPNRVDVKSPVGEARNEYVYRSDGTKLRVVHKWNPTYSTAPVIGSSVTESSLTKTETTDYLDNFVYVDNALKRVLLPNGYIENNGYYYYSKDHLGNTRITSNASGTKQQSVNYYPYGMQFGDASGSDVQPYKYSGKEYDGMHGMNLYDSDARYYDPATGRFTTMDPLAEKYYGWSPYAYCLNNPMRFVDPKGKDGWDVVYGYGIGLLTNILPTSGFLRDIYTPNDYQDYNNALRGVDNAAIALGSGMINAGGTGTVVGSTMAVAGVSVTVGSGGTAAVAGAPVAVLGGTLAGVSAAALGSGMVLMSTGNQNKDAGYKRGNGVQLNSKSIWKGKNGHLDIENPNPNNRVGQIHFQDSKNEKYMYNSDKDKFFGKNPETGEWNKSAPKSINKQLDDPQFRKAINKGLRYLNE